MLTAPTSLPVAPALPSALAFEQIIGEIAAGAALAIARALCKFQRDGQGGGCGQHGSRDHAGGCTLSGKVAREVGARAGPAADNAPGIGGRPWCPRTTNPTWTPCLRPGRDAK